MATASAPPDVDAAFDELVRLESAAGAASRPHAPSTDYLLQLLQYGSDAATAEHAQLGELLASFRAACAAREDFLTNAAAWNQYACDENVLGALCVKIGAVSG